MAEVHSPVSLLPEGLPFDRFRPEAQEYLAQPAAIMPLAGILIPLYIYMQQGGDDLVAAVILGMVALLSMIALRLRRWVVYSLVAIGMVLCIGAVVFHFAEIPTRDFGSDRDENAEIATMALLHGENPWDRTTDLNNNAITTGPSVLLLSAPFVLLTQKINGLTFLMWCVFIGILLYADITRRNNTFLFMVLLLLVPSTAFVTTWASGLDQLYYPAILLPFAWFALERERPLLAGLFAGFMVLCRLSYAPAAVALLLWWLMHKRPAVAEILRFVVGGFVYVAAVTGLMWVVSGPSFVDTNYVSISQFYAKAGVIANQFNFLTGAISDLIGATPSPSSFAMLLVLILTAAASVAMRHLSSPFFLVSVAALLTHTISFSVATTNPATLMDYPLTAIIPAIYGVVFLANREWDPALP